eukprot:m.168423 g.168423  ORF g.168423 m.168423 type:complete len:663 (+) comp18206_c0_seq5:180-2168(+)
METAVREAFLGEQIDLSTDEHKSTVTKGAQICRRYAINAGDLINKWTAYQHNNPSVGNIPTATALDGLQKELERAEKRSRQSHVQVMTPNNSTFNKDNAAALFSSDFMDAFGVEGDVSNSSGRPSAGGSGTFVTPVRRKGRNVTGGMVGAPMTPMTPLTDNSSAAQTPASTGGSGRDYNTRQNAGKVELTYNPEKRSTNTKLLKHPNEVDFAIFPTGVDKRYRYMFQKLRDVSDVLDARIDDIGDKIVKRNKLLAPKTDATTGETITPELAHVALPSQDQAPIIARVCLDSAGEGKLNDKSVLFEGSRDTSNGERVEVNLGEVPDFSLFPGQVVAAVGTNTTGTVFTPSVIYQGAAPFASRTSPEGFIDHYFSNKDGMDTEVLDILVAAGPFSTSQDLAYAPLDDLLDVIRRDKPDAVVLMGPFVDEEHPMVKGGDMRETFEEKFEEVVNRVGAVVIEETSTTELVLVPSLRDVHHDNVYPQPPFDLPDNMNHERLHCVSNPATFQLKEIVVGINSNDILMDLSKQEISRGQSGDRLGRLSNHLLEQRSYYPLCPPAPGVNMEYEQLDKIVMPVTPDVLILPSTMKYFAKNVNGSLVINPGRLCKHSSGGTYASVAVHAPRRNDIPEVRIRCTLDLKRVLVSFCVGLLEAQSRAPIFFYRCP